MPYCRNCGAELRNMASFCQACGTPVTRQANKAADPGNTMDRKYFAPSNEPTLTFQEYFVQSAPEEMRAYAKKMTFHTCFWGTLLPALFLLALIIATIIQFDELIETPNLFMLAMVVYILFSAAQVASVILSVRAIKKGSQSLSWIACILSYFGGLSLPATIISIVAVIKLNKYYKAYLLEKEGERY